MPNRNEGLGVGVGMLQEYDRRQTVPTPYGRDGS